MKKRTKLDNMLILWGLLVFTLIALLVYNSYLLNSKKNLNTEFVINEIRNCDNKITKYMELEDKYIYLYCLNDIFINDKSLKEYIEEYDVDKVIEKLNFYEELNDGNTKVFINDKIKLYACNDIYITSFKFEDALNHNFCEENN